MHRIYASGSCLVPDPGHTISLDNERVHVEVHGAPDGSHIAHRLTLYASDDNSTAFHALLRKLHPVFPEKVKLGDKPYQADDDDV